MLILGVDPGLNATGYGILDVSEYKPVLVEAGVIKPKRTAYLESKLKSIYQEFSDLLRETKPKKAALEDLYSHYKHPRTSIIMGHCRGVLLLACTMADIEVVSYSATKIKKAVTGNGRASKIQVSRAVCSYFNIESLAGPKDVSDALAAALTLAGAITHSK